MSHFEAFESVKRSFASGHVTKLCRKKLTRNQDFKFRTEKSGESNSNHKHGACFLVAKASFARVLVRNQSRTINNATVQINALITGGHSEKSLLCHGTASVIIRPLIIFYYRKIKSISQHCTWLKLIILHYISDQKRYQIKERISFFNVFNDGLNQ